MQLTTKHLRTSSAQFENLNTVISSFLRCSEILPYQHHSETNFQFRAFIFQSKCLFLARFSISPRLFRICFFAARWRFSVERLAYNFGCLPFSPVFLFHDSFFELAPLLRSELKIELNHLQSLRGSLLVVPKPTFATEH